MTITLESIAEEIRKCDRLIGSVRSEKDLGETQINIESTKKFANNIIEFYLKTNSEGREKIRQLFSECTNFSWWFLLFFPIDHDKFSETDFKNKLIFLSINDQGRDTRDWLLEIREDCKQARAKGYDFETPLKEIAELSSDIDKYGMGSTKHLMLSDKYIWNDF